MAANPRAEAARRRNEKILARGSDRLAAITGSLKPTPSSSAPVESKAEPARQGPSEELLTNAAAVRDTDAHGEGTNRGGLGDGSCVTAGVKAHGAGVRKDPSNQEPSQGVRLRAHAGGKAMLANAAKEALLCALEVPAAASPRAQGALDKLVCAIRATALPRLLLAGVVAAILSAPPWLPQPLLKLGDRCCHSASPLFVFLLLEALLIVSAWLLHSYSSSALPQTISSSSGAGGGILWALASHVVPGLKSSLRGLSMLAYAWQQVLQDCGVFFFVLLSATGTYSPGPQASDQIFGPAWHLKKPWA